MGSHPIAKLCNMRSRGAVVPLMTMTRPKCFHYFLGSAVTPNRDFRREVSFSSGNSRISGSRSTLSFSLTFNRPEVEQTLTVAMPKIIRFVFNKDSVCGIHTTALVGSSEKNIICGECSHSFSNTSKQFVSMVSCPKCGALQKILSSELPNLFEILGHEKSFRVDVQSMANKTKQLQKKFHPDLYSQKGEDQQNLSQEYSSLVNKALWTLTDPILRGRYMLLLGGLSPDDPENDIEKSMTTDPEFLEEVMELNERLEEITSEKDWKEFRTENDETMERILMQLEDSFGKNDFKEAQRLLGRLKYFHTLQQKLKELQSRIGIVE